MCAVLGADVRRATSYAEAAGAFVAVNEAWAEGMGGSLRAGLDSVERPSPEAIAALILLVDQPDITANAIAAVLSARRGPDDDKVLAAAIYEGRRGHPVLIGRAHWDALRPTLVGDVGARKYLQAHRRRAHPRTLRRHRRSARSRPAGGPRHARLSSDLCRTRGKSFSARCCTGVPKLI